jgi:hypothetical protein
MEKLKEEEDPLYCTLKGTSKGSYCCLHVRGINNYFSRETKCPNDLAVQSLLSEWVSFGADCKLLRYRLPGSQRHDIRNFS